jgi:predicted lipoprotein
MSFIYLLVGCTVVPLDENNKPILKEESFNAASYVNDLWDTKIVPIIVEESSDIHEVLTALYQNPAEASNKYGLQPSSGGNYVFKVKGEGKVLELNGDKLVMDLLPADGEPDISISIGPAFTGSDIRDAVGFINFNDFETIVAYQNIAKEINRSVREKVVNEINKETIVGKTVSFWGAFSLVNMADILITPVKLQIKE